MLSNFCRSSPLTAVFSQEQRWAWPSGTPLSRIDNIQRHGIVFKGCQIGIPVEAPSFLDTFIIMRFKCHPICIVETSLNTPLAWIENLHVSEKPQENVWNCVFSSNSTIYRLKYNNNINIKFKAFILSLIRLTTSFWSIYQNYLVLTHFCVTKFY